MHLLGVRTPPPHPYPPEDVKDRKTTGVNSSWLAQHFGVPLPEDAEEADVARFAKAWLWHLLGIFLFPDASDNTVSWMWTPILAQDWEVIGEYSWGSATLRLGFFISNFVMLVGAPVIILILVDVPSFCNCGCGSGCPSAVWNDMQLG